MVIGPLDDLSSLAHGSGGRQKPLIGSGLGGRSAMSAAPATCSSIAPETPRPKVQCASSSSHEYSAGPHAVSERRRTPKGSNHSRRPRRVTTSIEASRLGAAKY